MLNRKSIRVSFPTFSILALTVGWLFSGSPALIAQEAEQKTRAAKAAAAEAKAALAKEAAAAAEKAAAAKQAEAKAETEDEGDEADKKADAKDAQAEKKDEKKKPPKNPLGNLIRGIFGGPQKTRPAVPGVKMIEDPDKDKRGVGDRFIRDHIDARAPYDTRQEKLLQRVRSYMEEGDWTRAREALQRLLDQPESALYRVGVGQMVPIRNEANRLLANFPPDELARYREFHGVTARLLLKEAYSEGNPEKFVEVADRFFHTDAGYEATNHLGSLHFDRGEFGMAAYRFGHLLEANAGVTNDPSWQFKAAFAFAKSDQHELSRKLIERLAVREGGHSLGSGAVDPSQWLATTSKVRVESDSTLDEWPMFQGTPSHRAGAAGGVPLLLPRWHQPLTNNRNIAEQLRFLVEDLADSKRAAVPAFFPLTVGGKAVYRSFRGVRVVDAESGDLLWETDGGISPDRIMNGDVREHVDGRVVWKTGANRTVSAYQGSGADRHPLTGLMFRNGVFGTLNSDGRRLFVIEDHAILSRYQPGYRRNSSGGSRDDYRRDWSSNKLVAYDIETGHPVWEIGGSDNNEPFDLRYAGNYFFGSPTPDGGDLFLVGEKDSELRLFCLDAETGEAEWSQLIAFSDVNIDTDFGRRWWTSQPAVGEGVVVCPTTVGWLVAVDRINHAVLWAHRYSRPTGSRRGRNSSRAAVVPSTPLNNRWSPSAPVIAGDRVIFTPPEEPIIDCVRLHDGARIWKADKGTNIYLAGVQEDMAILVGTTAVTALSIEDGTTQWTLPLPDDEGQPSGQGIFVGEEYYLPLASGVLWRIRVADGSIVAKQYQPKGASALGNLAMSHGTLVALSAQGLRSFEQRDAILAKIRERKQDNPRDAWALIRESEIRLLNRHYDEALGLLRQVERDAIAEELRPRYRSRMIESLAAVIRSDLEGSEERIQELATFVKAPAERLLERQLQAEHLLARGEYVAAYDVYQQLAAESSGQLLVRTDDDRVSVRLDAWVRGQFEDLWNAAPPEVRRELDARFQSLADTALAGNRKDQERFIALFGFHPSVHRVRFHLADSYAESGDLFHAEKVLLNVGNAGDSAVAVQAQLRRARLYANAGLRADAAETYRDLLESSAKTKLPDGRTVLETVTAVSQSENVPLKTKPAVSDWSDKDVRMVRNAGSSSTQFMYLDNDAMDAAFFQEHRFQYDPNSQRLTVFEAENDELHWSLGLRGARSYSSSYPATINSGHQMMVLHRDVLNCLSPAEKRVVWTRPVDNRQRASSYYRNTSRPSIPSMQMLTNLTSASTALQAGRRMGMLAFANSKFVGHYGRREFSVLDADSGEVRWRRDRIPTQTTVIGTRDVVYIVPPNTSAAYALRASDGKQLDVPDLAGLLRSTLHAVGEDLVVATTKTRSLLGLGGSTVSIRRFNPRTKEEHWKIDLPGKCYASMLDDTSALLLRPSGELEILNLETGTLKKLGAIPVADLRKKSNLYAFGDRDRVYFILNERRSRSYSSGSMPSLRVNGTVYGLDRHEGELLWSREVGQQNLLLTDLRTSPVLLFASRQWGRVAGSYRWTSRLLAIEKVTGRKLAESSGNSSTNFQSLRINMADGYLELRSYNQRVRLVAVARDPDAESSPESESDEGKGTTDESSAATSDAGGTSETETTVRNLDGSPKR